MLDRLKTFFESQAFGVCAYLGDRLKLPVAHLRLSFIYITFLGFGSPVLLYFGIALLLKLRNFLRGKENPVWDR